MYLKKVQYLVKWRGYQSEDIWEPEAYLTDCKALDAFLASLQSSGDDQIPELAPVSPSSTDRSIFGLAMLSTNTFLLISNGEDQPNNRPPKIFWM